MRQASRFAGPGDSPGFLLWQITNGWQRWLRAALEPLGLTHVQFVLLATATWLAAEAPPTQRQLADMARTDPMMTSQVVRVLERRGLLRRSADPVDRRAYRLSPTAAGRELASAAIKVVEDADEEFFAPVDAPALTELLRPLAAPPGR